MSKFSYPVESEEHGNVNSPIHYQGKVECIDCIESATAGLNGIEAFVQEMLSSICIDGKRKTA